MRWLVHDFDNRDPKDKLHDIDCGGYLEALSELRHAHRQMLEDNDMHTELAEIGGKYHVTKIVKKREAEYLQGNDHFFFLDKEGNRIPVDEEEWDRITGGVHNPEDVYNVEGVELTGLEEHTAPMDVWDIIFDATQYVMQAQQFIEAYQDGRVKLEHGETPLQRLVKMQDELIYSADWFPYPVDKRLTNPLAKQLAAEIEEGLTRGQVSYRLRKEKGDGRVEAIKKMTEYANKLRPGRERAQVRNRMQELKDQMSAERKAKRNKPLKPELSNSDRRKLWSLWREREMRVNGSVTLMSWQFEPMYRAKLTRLGIDSDTMNEMVREAMNRLFKTDPQNKPNHYAKAEPELPTWLAEAPTPEYTSNEDECEEFVSDWLPEAGYTDGQEEMERVLSYETE